MSRSRATESQRHRAELFLSFAVTLWLYGYVEVKIATVFPAFFASCVNFTKSAMNSEKSRRSAGVLEEIAEASITVRPTIRYSTVVQGPR